MDNLFHVPYVRRRRVNRPQTAPSQILEKEKYAQFSLFEFELSSDSSPGDNKVAVGAGCCLSLDNQIFFSPSYSTFFCCWLLP